jgi:hypothetical protein
MEIIDVTVSLGANVADPVVDPTPIPDPSAVIAEAKVAIAALNELAALVAMVKQHNVAGLVGELRAAFSALAAAHQAPSS